MMQCELAGRAGIFAGTKKGEPIRAFVCMLWLRRLIFWMKSSQCQDYDLIVLPHSRWDTPYLCSQLGPCDALGPLKGLFPLPTKQNLRPGIAWLSVASAQVTPATPLDGQSS